MVAEWRKMGSKLYIIRLEARKGDYDDVTVNVNYMYINYFA